MKLNLNTLKAKTQNIKDSVAMVRIAVKPTINKYKEVVKERGIKASFQQFLEENPQTANHIYAAQQTIKAVARASLADKVLLPLFRL